jgi:hypothetical protein
MRSSPRAQTGFSRRILLAAAFIALPCLTGVAAAQAQVRPKVDGLAESPKTAIFIGNSFFYYNNSMHNQVLSLARNADPQNKSAYAATSVTISGSGMNWHNVEAYFTADGMASYTFDDDNKVVLVKRDKKFDVAIMMDCSQCPIHPQLKAVFTAQSAKQIAAVRKFGAAPVLFMSWAYADKPEMTAQLSDAYTTAGNANDALVIPAGLAFARAIAKRPDLNLYAADKRHPSPAGTYLAACVTFAALYKRTPVGNAYSATLDPATASFLQAVAWETVQDYYKK